jgi:hypothetical protein
MKLLRYVLVVLSVCAATVSVACQASDAMARAGTATRSLAVISGRLPSAASRQDPARIYILAMPSRLPRRHRTIPVPVVAASLVRDGSAFRLPVMADRSGSGSKITKDAG